MAPGSEASWLCSAAFPISQRNHESIRIRWGADVCPSCWEECQGPVADTHMTWRLYRGRLWKGQPGMELSVLSSTCLVKKPSGWLPSLLAPASSEVSGGAYCLLNGIQCAPKLFMETGDIFSGK